MGLRTVFKTAGHWFKGLIVKVDSEIQFDTTTNPEIDSTGGNFVWKTRTTSANSWKLNDPGTTEDIIITDTLAKTFTLHSNYTASGFGVASEEFYLERIETIDENSATPIEYFTEVQGGTEISNIVSATGGTYKMEICFVCANTSTGGSVIVEPQIGGVAVFSQVYEKEPKDTDDIHYVSISKRVTLVAGNNTIQLELSNKNGGTARMFEANITLTKI